MILIIIANVDDIMDHLDTKAAGTADQTTDRELSQCRVWPVWWLYSFCLAEAELLLWPLAWPETQSNIAQTGTFSCCETYHRCFCEI